MFLLTFQEIWITDGRVGRAVRSIGLTFIIIPSGRFSEFSTSFPWGGVLKMMDGGGFGRSGCLVCRACHMIISLQVYD